MCVCARGSCLLFLFEWIRSSKRPNRNASKRTKYCIRMNDRVYTNYTTNTDSHILEQTRLARPHSSSIAESVHAGRYARRFN